MNDTTARTRSPRAAFALALLVGLALLAGCSTGQSGDQGTAVDAMQAPVEAIAPAPADAAAAANDKATVIGPQVLMTAWLTLRVDSVASSLAEVSAAVSAQGGTIQQQDLSSIDGFQTATVIARVPAAGLDAFLADVQRRGTVESVSRQATDVTQQRIDLDARIGALTASVTRLRELLDQAANVADLVAVETELANRQAELDALTAQRDYLADQVAMSTVTITLVPTVRAGGAEAPGFLTGLQNGLAALVGAVALAITAVGFLLPFLAILAIIAIPVTVVVIRRRRRSD